MLAILITINIDMFVQEELKWRILFLVWDCSKKNGGVRTILVLFCNFILKGNIENNKIYIFQFKPPCPKKRKSNDPNIHGCILQDIDISFNTKQDDLLNL